MAQYIVKKGDNLSIIAKKNGVKLNEIVKLNNISNLDLIQIGQKINLPSRGESTNSISLKNNTTKPYKEFLEDQLKVKTPENNWKKITPSIQGKTIAEFDKKKDTPTKQVINKPITKPITKEEEESFFSQIKNKISETYSDIKTAVDQQTSKKTVAKPEVKIDDSFIDYGYKELGTYKDESFKAGKKDSLLSAINVFDNDKGFDYIVSPKVKEGKKTFNNVKGVAHFLMDSDITPNQKYTDSYLEKGNNIVKSAQAGKFTPYLGKNPDDYVMYYKNTGNSKMNVKYGQLKDKDKYKGYEQIKVRSIPFGELDFNNKKSAGFAKKASYIGTLDGKQTSIITNPESNDVYGRFSGGSGIFYFKEPKTGKTISVDVSGSVNTIKQVGEELSKKYNVDPKQLQFLYHDMGSYSAKPKSHNGVISNEQWENYNSNNKGYSGAALMYPMEHGGKITAETIYSMSKQPKVILTPNDIYAKDGAKVKSGVWNNFEPIDYNRADDYPDAERISGGLQDIENPENGKIYIYDERPFHYKEGRFQEYYSPEEIKQVLKFRGKQEANKTSIPSEISNPITNMLNNTDSPYREFIRKQKFQVGGDEYKNGGKIDLSNTVGDRKVFSLEEFKNIVPDYQYQGYLNSGKEGLYKNINKLKYPVLVDTLPDGSMTFRPYSYESAETSYEDYKKLSQSDQPIKATPIKTFAGGGMMSGMMGGGQGGGNGAGMIMQGVTQAIGGIFSTLDAQKKATEQQGQQNLQNTYQIQQINDLKAMELEQQQPQPYNKGGIVQAWIQKFLPGGGVQQLNYPTTQYSNWYMNQNEEFNPYSQYNINSQLSNNAQVANTSVPNVQTNFPQNIGTNYQTSANASQDQINKDNKMADEMMGKTSMDKPKGEGFMSTMQDYGKAVDAIGSTMGDFSNRNGDVRNSAWQTAKKGAAESNPVFGFFHGIDEGLQSIGKMAGGNKGQKGVQFFTDPIGFIMNLGSGIKEREDKKREQQLEYDDRNKMPTIKEPSHYGNYHAKYGSNIKNMEQRVIDDIYSDFDKHFKLT